MICPSENEKKIELFVVLNEEKNRGEAELPPRSVICSLVNEFSETHNVSS